MPVALDVTHYVYICTKPVGRLHLSIVQGHAVVLLYLQVVPCIDADPDFLDSFF